MELAQQNLVKNQVTAKNEFIPNSFSSTVHIKYNVSTTKRITKCNYDCLINYYYFPVSDQVCSSWWCPKHSPLAKVTHLLEPQDAEETRIIKLAILRQKYWICGPKVRCCVFDRKRGINKHLVPSECFKRFLKLEVDQDFMDQKKKESCFKKNELPNVSILSSECSENNNK